MVLSTRPEYTLQQTLIELTAGDLQLALAIANESTLRSLLCQCTPALARSSQVDRVKIQVGVPLAGHEVPLDALMQFEQVHCRLSHQGSPPAPAGATAALPDYQALTPYHSNLQTLVYQVTPEDAIATLTHAGFSPTQSQAILHLPSQAWHKTWWWQLDQQGYPSHPFHRWMRLRCHSNGTLTLQYQDHSAHALPDYFYSEARRVPVAIRSAALSFAATLAFLNQARIAFNTPYALLIGGPLSDLEAEGFMHQSVSLYGLR
jgi:hypothetical protein